MKFLSICSGIEAASVAWHDLGFECVGVSEIDKFPSEVLKYHYPSVPNLGDMTNYKEWNDDLAPDLLVGGTPCQSFSVAGLRKGMDDPRGNLALTYVGIAAKYKPQWFIWENVPGVLSSNGGKDFSSFLSAMADIGYGIAYRVLDAQFFGVPQRRRRVFVVGHLGDYRPATAVLFEPTSVFGHTAKGRKKGKGTTASAETSPRTDDCKRIGNFDLYDFPKEGISPTLNALRAKDCIVYSGSIKADKIGALIEAQFWNGTQTAESLTATSNNQRMPDKGRMQMVVEPNVYENHATDSRVKPINVSSTVTSRWGTGGNNIPFVREEPNTMRVRRLTPTECERLQGFPDGWTQIPYGKKTKEQCPDGHRYKALGNSMAVPVMKWIGRRIKLFNEVSHAIQNPKVGQAND